MSSVVVGQALPGNGRASANGILIKNSCQRFTGKRWQLLIQE
jgi:hypothetical protein